MNRMLAAKTVESGNVGRVSPLRSPARPTAAPAAPGSPDSPARTAGAVEDRLEISEEARELFAASERSGGKDAAGRANAPATGTDAGAGMTSTEGEPTEPEGALDELSEEERAHVRELQTRDNQVRAHENAHAGAGGAFAGSPTYDYQQGPDGRRYAVGGEVSISVRGGSSPDETARNARQVRSAALAPSDPSAQDLRVAARATAMETEARAELSRVKQEELTEGSAAPDVVENGEAPLRQAGSPFATQGGGSLDPRVDGYGRTPEAAQEGILALDLFG